LHSPHLRTALRGSSASRRTASRLTPCTSGSRSSGRLPAPLPPALLAGGGRGAAEPLASPGFEAGGGLLLGFLPAAPAASLASGLPLEAAGPPLGAAGCWELARGAGTLREGLAAASSAAAPPAAAALAAAAARAPAAAAIAASPPERPWSGDAALAVRGAAGCTFPGLLVAAGCTPVLPPRFPLLPAVRSPFSGWPTPPVAGPARLRPPPARSLAACLGAAAAALLAAAAGPAGWLAEPGVALGRPLRPSPAAPAALPPPARSGRLLGCATPCTLPSRPLTIVSPAQKARGGSRFRPLRLTSTTRCGSKGAAGCGVLPAAAGRPGLLVFAGGWWAPPALRARLAGLASCCCSRGRRR
jgi:hypothetical protein